MTQEEAVKKQAELAKHFKLSFWYGTRCKKCCGVYPKFRTTNGFDSKCYYECEVCGTRTEEKSMPWIAEEAWNKGDLILGQFGLF